MNYEIIASGSRGNAVLIEDCVMIDCGVPFKALDEKWKKIRLVLLTHIHGDHFCKATIRNLGMLRPTLRFGCGRWLVPHVLMCGIAPENIDVLEMDKRYDYGIAKIQPFHLTHNVENCGYKMQFATGRCIYATDMNNLNGITAKDYDLYLVEGNYSEDEIEAEIEAKTREGVYAYERAARENHFSRERCIKWLDKNATAKSECVFMHVHEKKGDKR